MALKIPTLGSSGFLYQVSKHRQQWLDEIDRRRAAILFLALVMVITAGVIAWIVRPL